MPDPTVVSIDVRTSAAAGPDSAERFAVRFVGRTVGHLDRVDVGAIVSAYLENLDEDIPSAVLEDCPEFMGTEILRITSLVETVLDEAKKQLHRRLLIDTSTNLVPRLRPIPQES